MKTLKGFTLLELVISIAIAAIISISLTMLLNQSYASQKKLDALTHLHERATLLFTQLERDLMGATIPIENILALEAESSSAKATADRAKKESTVPAPPSEGKKEEAVYKPFDRVFYYKRAPNQLFFSWITHNPLQLYWGSAVGAARPRIARVMYRLEQDPTDKTLFKLMRSEGFDLTYTPYEKYTEQKYKGYALVEDIKSLKITLTAVIEKKEEEKKEVQVPAAQAGKPQKKEQKPPTTEVKTLDTWEWPRPKDESSFAKAPADKEKKEQELPPLPQGIRIELILWDAATEREVTFDYGIYIPSLPVLQRERKESSSAKATADMEQKPDEKQPGAPTQPNPGGPQVNSNVNRNPLTGLNTSQPIFNLSAPEFNVLNFGPGQNLIRRTS